MVETSFNLFDAIVIGVVLLSALLSFFRGFVSELLSLGSWVAAAFITLLYAPDVAESIRTKIDHGPAALMVASAATFFGAKIVFSIFNMLLMKLLKKGKDVGVLDNLLGLGFGFLRAALLISLGYYVYSFVASEENQPPWIADAYTREYAAMGAKTIEPLLEDFMEEITPMLEERMETAEPGSSENMKQLLEATQQLKNADGHPTTEDGWIDVEEMQRLMDGAQQMQESQRNREQIQRLIQEKQRNQPQPTQ